MPTDQDGARTAQNWEEQEMEALRKHRPTLSVDDLDDTEEIGESIADTVTMLLHQYAVEAGVKRVYLCGSFARGEAIPAISDLDARAVLDSPVDPFTAESIEDGLKSDIGFEIIPDQAGFLDARLATKDPAEDTPAVLVWESDLE